MATCVFCEIAAGRIDPDLTVFENEHVLAQVSLAQKSGSHGHALVIPQPHLRDIYDVPAALNEPLMAALRLLARATKAAFGADGIQIRQNNGPAAGQDVFHLHFHIIPRFTDDAFDNKPYEQLARPLRVQLAEKLKLAVRAEQAR